MPNYQPIAVIAARLQIDTEMLLDFHRKGWIQAVTKNGAVFLSADQHYRAKYILHLSQTKHLSDEQIQLVLSIQRPPYSAAEVDEILKQHALPPRPKRADA
ncbi:MAG: hypothetical protein DMG59_26545 [Acidobacteria bacterium]|nr:MAG: hypothetical protein DMG59_26545 [Acidobacteriota bacterium]